MDYRLFLIRENNSRHYEESEKIEIFHSELIFAIEEKISPLGGGNSFIFYKAKIVGRIVSVEPCVIDPAELSIQEKGKEFISVGVSESDINKHKQAYENFQKKSAISSKDWLDFCD